MTNQTRRCQGEVISDFEQLLNAFVGNEMTHCGTVIGTNYNTPFERDAYGAGSGLHNGLVF